MDRRPPDTKRTDPLFPYTTRVRSEAARERLAQAHKALQAAERELVEAREAFFRAKARQEALEKRRDSWRGEQRALEARQEEDITADLLMARSHGARPTPCEGRPWASNAGSHPPHRQPPGTSAAPRPPPPPAHPHRASTRPPPRPAPT